MSATIIYNIISTELNGEYKHFLKSDFEDFECILPTSKKLSITYNSHKSCLFCENTRRSKKDAFVCRKCRETKSQKEVSKNAGKIKTFLKCGLSHKSKLNSTQEKKKNTNLKKYGVENPMQNRDIKNKQIKTVKSIYGVNNVSQLDSIKKKKKQTSLDNYGVESPMMDLTVREKLKNSILDKYNVENISQLDSIKKKKKQTSLDNYGVENYLKVKKHAEEINKKSVISRQLNRFRMSFEDFKKQWLNEYYEYGLVYCKNKYNLSETLLLKKFIPQEDKQISTSLNEKMINEVFDLDFETNVRKILPSNGRLEIDLLNRENKVSIEFNGYYWHQIKNDKILDDLLKAEEMRDLDYKHFALDETDMDKLKLLNKMINPNKTKLYARKLTLKEINNPKEFLNENHLQGNVNAKVAYGLFLNDELIQTMTFGKSRFDKSIDWEILRLCTKPEYLVVGGAERLFKSFMKKYKPNSVVSYSDNKYFDGSVYKKLGMKFIENTTPNYVWWKNGISLKRYKTMKHRLKDVLGENFDTELTEKENMLNNGWIQIKDLGNKKWIAM